MSKLTTVHVRINDAATGKPTPVRLRITDAAGDYYPPLGRLSGFALGTWGEDVGGNLLWGGKEYAFVDGTCEVPLPAGPLLVEASKGPEYLPLRQEVSLPAGKLALRLSIGRWINLREQGWYSGDTWVHMTPHAALLEAGAEDVAVVNVLAFESYVLGAEGRQYPAIHDILAFSGQRPALEMPGHMVVVNTLNTHPVLGRLALLNCHRVVHPLAFGGPDGEDDWALDEWCGQCHRKGGLVVGQFFAGTHHGELLANLVHGKIDALEPDSEFENPESGESELDEWYRLLDCGIRVPFVRGSLKYSNLSPLGLRRTYARLRPGEEFSYKTWIEAIRAGRTFVTNGPLLSFTVNGEDPGAVLDLPGTNAVVRARAEVRSLLPFDRVEVVANGQIVGSARGTGHPASATVETEVVLPRGGWLMARCVGSLDAAEDEWAGAWSSPVYVEVDGKPRPADPAAVAHFAACLGQTLDWVMREARCPTPRDRERLAEVIRTALDKLRTLTVR